MRTMAMGLMGLVLWMGSLGQARACPEVYGAGGVQTVMPSVSVLASPAIVVQEHVAAFETQACGVFSSHSAVRVRSTPRLFQRLRLMPRSSSRTRVRVLVH